MAETKSPAGDPALLFHATRPNDLTCNLQPELRRAFDSSFLQISRRYHRMSS